MNIQSDLRKIHNKVKTVQTLLIDAQTPEEIWWQIYIAGMYDMSKLLMNLWNGDLTGDDIKKEFYRWDKRIN